MLDIRYDIGTGDKRYNRYRTIEHILEDKEKIHGSGLTEDKLDNHDNYRYTLADSLTGRIELLVLETKSGHDGLYNEMLNIIYDYY